MKAVFWRWGVWAAAGLTATLVSAAPPEADLLRVRTLAATCAACHGTDGVPPPNTLVPALAGLPATVFSGAMQAFRSGARPATVMPQIAKGYSDAQIAQLAAYFAAQRPAAAVRP